MSIKVSATEGVVRCLPRKLVNESLDNLIDDIDVRFFKRRKICPTEVINLEGYPEFVISYNPMDRSAFVFLTSEESQICPEGIINIGGRGISIGDILSAENN